jgi:hypothetical protein
MARDYTKYKLSSWKKGVGKSRMVFKVVEHYARTMNMNYEELKEQWWDNIQGGKGIIRMVSEIDAKNERNYYMKESVTLSDGTNIVVCNQWGKENFSNFLLHAGTLGYVITTEGDDNATSEPEEIRTENTSEDNIVEDSPDWNIIHDIATFYLFFGNLAVKAAQKKEWNIISENLKKWKFGIEKGGVSNNFEIKNAKHFENLVNEVYDALYIIDNEPQKDPFEQLNNSLINLVNYFNSGVLNCAHLKTFLFTIYEICKIDSFTPEQEHQLKWYINQFKTVCPNVESIEHLIKLSKNQNNLKSVLNSLDIDTDLLDNLFNN